MALFFETWHPLVKCHNMNNEHFLVVVVVVVVFQQKSRERERENFYAMKKNALDKGVQKQKKKSNNREKRAKNQ